MSFDEWIKELETLEEKLFKLAPQLKEKILKIRTYQLRGVDTTKISFLFQYEEFLKNKIEEYGR